MTMVVFVVGCSKEKNPEVKTSEVREITARSVLGGGVVVSADENGVVIERGVCWGTQPDPEVSGDHITAEGIGTGSYICRITGLTPNTTYYVRAYAINSKGIGYGENVSFTTEAHDYVDLGLPSRTLWATWNVGATTPEGYGDLFAWGETTPKTNYNWSTYKYCNGDYDQLTKYCDDSNYGYNGFTDNLTILQSTDDAATANWGTGWCTPTKEQWKELYQNTTNQWTTQNGVSGMLFTAWNGETLFLPAAGRFYGDELINAGLKGEYMSSSLLTIDYPYNVWLFFFSADFDGVDGGPRKYGRSVRPVRSAR